MGRNIIFWSIIALSVACPLTSRATGRAALELSQFFYEKGEEEILSHQWRPALKAFELASLLNPNFKEAATKEIRLQKTLQEKADWAYRQGLRDYQALRVEEAKKNWEFAMQCLWEETDPLRPKLERALRRTLGHDGPWTRDYGPGATDLGKGKGTEVEEKKDSGKMGEVKKFLESGEALQGVLSLKEMLNQNPNDARLKDIYARLHASVEKEKDHASLSESIKNKFSQAEAVLNEAKSAQANNHFVAAYQKFKEALLLFKENDLKPPFYPEIEEGLSQTEGQLQKEGELLLQKCEGELKSDAADLKTLGFKLKEVVKNYPPIPKAEELLKRIYDRLQAKAEPLLMKAVTLQQLEGCHGSVDIYTTVEKEAVFTEVPSWQEAHKNLEGCLISQNKLTKGENHEEKNEERKTDATAQ